VDNLKQHALDMDEEQAQRQLRGIEAEVLLQQPIISQFFEKRFRACYDAFVGLPMGATLQQYQTVHHDLLAIQALRNELEQHIRQAKADRYREDLMPEEESGV